MKYLCQLQIHQRISRGIFENVTAKWTLSVQQFFRPKTHSSHYKSAAIVFSLLLLSFSRLLLFLLSLSFVTVILDLIGLKKPAFSVK